PPPPRLEEGGQRRHVVQRAQAGPDQIAPPPVRPRARPTFEARAQGDHLGAPFDAAGRPEREPGWQSDFMKHGILAGRTPFMAFAPLVIPALDSDPARREPEGGRLGLEISVLLSRRPHRPGEFWIGWLVLLGVNVVAGWIPLIGWLLALVSIYCSICICSHSLHDMGKSGWLQLVPFVICTIAGGFAFVSMGAGVMMGALSGGADEMVAASV